MKRFISSFFFFSFLLFHSPLMAFDFAESLQIHGFFSQGYLNSNNNNFLASDSIDGSFEFTDIGLNANLSLFNNLRIGGQLFYRNLGDYCEDDITVDWAIIDYQPFDFFGLKVGKVKMPIGLYNENRDSDFLLPMIFLPQSVYDETRRDTYLAYVGAGVYGNVRVGSWGDVDYHFFLGDVDFPSDSVLLANLENSIQSNIDRNNAISNASKRNPAIPSVYNSAERESDHVYGGAFIYNSEFIEGLRFGVSFLHAKYEVFVNDLSKPTGETLIHGKFVISAEYSWRDFVFISEYSETDRTSIQFDRVSLDGPSQSWYGMINYTPFEHWTFSAMYDEFYRLKDDKDGSSRPQISSATSWRKDVGVGARWEINDYWVAKAEYHWIDGAAMQLGTFNPDGSDRYWHYGAARISFIF
ncbi:MAG: hypothetical protein KQH63_08800 [Desulfobulbaceae bacterium]|nr:hypothetical protein [Desulfobulbaceae bacterium]